MRRYEIKDALFYVYLSQYSSTMRCSWDPFGLPFDSAGLTPQHTLILTWEAVLNDTAHHHIGNEFHPVGHFPTKERQQESYTQHTKLADPGQNQRPL